MTKEGWVKRMRPIDADACESYFWEHLDDNGMAAAMNAINDMPTIEPQRKTGRWIPLQLSMANPPYQCSCCFQNAPMIETGCLMNRHLEALLTHFCPNCGAEMTEEKE